MTEAKKYRKKPVEIEARRFSGIAELIDVEGLALWCGGEFKYDDKPGQEHKAHYWSINIPTLEGTMRAVPGDFIIKGVQGDDPVNTWDQATEKQREFWRNEADYVLRSRATVPDAATERDECALPGHAGCKRVMVDGEPWVDHFPAERDAALAAIERIREAVSGHPECDRYSEDDVISCGWKSAYASVVAALDGAPEPEEKP